MESTATHFSAETDSSTAADAPRLAILRRTPSPPEPQGHNHGKRWTAEDDHHILHCPSTRTDAELAQILRRSEQAVKNRRAVLAAKGLAVDKEAGESSPFRLPNRNNNNERTVQEPRQSRAATATAGKDHPPRGGPRGEGKPPGRRAPAHTPNPGEPSAQATTTNHRSFPRHAIIAPLPPRATTTFSPGPPQTTRPNALVSAIGAICGHIRGTNGQIDRVWAQDALVPTLVQFHAGFQAYAAYIAEHGGNAG